MFSRHRTKGVFLKSQDRGESDRFFTVYTSDFGKVNLFAKSIRKRESKLRFGTSFSFLNEIEFIEGKNYKTLTDIRIIDDYKLTRKNLSACTLAHKACEDVDLLTREEEKDRNVWLLLNTFLKRINCKEEMSISIYLCFIWKLFSFLGYKPELEQCVICSQKIKGNLFYFSAVEGGLVGPCCLEKANSPIAVTMKIIDLMKLFSKREFIFSEPEKGNHLENEIWVLSEDYLQNLSYR